jgi:hypothetical protein
MNSSKEERITQSTFLHKGCLPIPQLFGARDYFQIRESNPPVSDPPPDFQR